MQIDDTARAVFDTMREGITIIDTDGIIVFGNQAYRNFLNKEAGGDIGPIEGYRLRDLRPGARLPDVLETGKPLLHISRQEIEDFYFVNMYPIYENGKLTGGLSVVTFMEDAYQAKEELETLEAKSKQVLRRVNKTSSTRYTFDSIVAQGKTVAAVKDLAQKAAATDAPVLLASESGTGKELYAQAIHNASPRRKEVFVAVNCANFNTSLLESELFGYVEGSFTGARKGGKIGLFEAANGGTLFLDEISEMDMGLQAKLLRVLQEGKIRPVGGVKEVEVDVRVIFASNADLHAYIAAGKFRRDLYYRMSTFLIRIPPLRERLGDIPVLAEDILNELAKKVKRPLSISRDALEVLMSHDWPGNVRELRNVLEFSAYLSEDGVVTPDTLPGNLLDARSTQEQIPLNQRVRMFERGEIQKLLLRYGSTLEGKKKAAAELGISLATLYNKLGNTEF